MGCLSQFFHLSLRVFFKMSFPTDPELKKIFQLKNIAVIGCSSNPLKPSHTVPKYLHENGYNVIPVNPNTTEEIFNKTPCLSLSEIHSPIDIVNIFRPSTEIPSIVDSILKHNGPGVIWMQSGIQHDASAKIAEKNGNIVIQNKCIMVEHRRLISP